MITRPNDRALQAMSSLENHPDFRVLREWLAECLTETQNRCIKELDEVKLRQAQGAASDLDELIRHISSARRHIDQSRAD